MNKPTTKLNTTTEIFNWFESNETERREKIINAIKNHDYIKNTLDLTDLGEIKMSFTLAEELQRCLDNKATLNIMRTLINLGLKPIIK
jgi:hypothetical protein